MVSHNTFKEKNGGLLYINQSQMNQNTHYAHNRTKKYQTM